MSEGIQRPALQQQRCHAQKMKPPVRAAFQFPDGLYFVPVRGVPLTYSVKPLEITFAASPLNSVT